jgi:hypothetical protein
MEARRSAGGNIEACAGRILPMIMTDERIDSYNSLRPSEYGFLQSLVLKQEVQPELWHGLNVKIKLSSLSGTRLLCLEFSGVRDLRVGSIQGLMQYRFEVRSIRGDQIEGLYYKVTESEHDVFSFLCKEFTSEVCES